MYRCLSLMRVRKIEIATQKKDLSNLPCALLFLHHSLCTKSINIKNANMLINNLILVTSTINQCIQTKRRHKKVES